MDLLRKIWDWLEVSKFNSRLTRAVASIGIVVLIQLVTLCAMFFLLSDIAQLSKDAQNSEPIV